MELLKNKKQLGFTLLEMIIVILVVSIGILGAYGVYSRVFSYTGQSISSLQATYLAQEGIEIVRNIRDTNWVNGTCWSTMVDTSGNSIVFSVNPTQWEADYNSSALTSIPSSGTERYLNINASGLYSYGAGKSTKYQRKITITLNADDTLSVVSLVTWKDKGQDYKVSVQENLYDWWPSTAGSSCQ